MASTNIMLKKCEGLIDTTDITAWENAFLKRVLDMTANGNRPDRLSEKQVETLERIYQRNFAD